MIVFRKISYRNFLSTGNTPSEISFDTHNTTLIIGDNGSGKSTVLDALTFGLFGKPFRNIKKDQLVNTVNERDCKVEVHFDIGKRHYHIIRCIKPNRFEIYVNGKMLNQDASIRDYQKHLENSILKLNYRSFTQVVILGSSSFIPFMQLTPAHRREVVEEILDIKIFSMMNVILKHKMKDMKEKETDIVHQLNLTETKITMAEEHINQTKEKSKMSKTALEKKIEKNKKDIEELNTQALSLMTEVVDWRDNVLPKEQSFKKEQSDFIGVRVKLNDNSNRMEKEINFFKENDDCPTCEQPIDDEFKERAIEKRADKMITNACALTRMDEQIGEMNAREGLYSKISNDVRDKEVESAKKTTSANSILSFNEQLTDQINDLLSIDADLVEEKTKLKLYRDELKTIEKHKNKLTEDNNYLTLAKQLLNDSGIKTKVVKRYLPVMNKLINSYLSALEFQVKFELDEQFNETIRSRYRDVFGYANFSEGEKMRIDLALLFTWRQIAKMKNSTNTNLLILDEIFDSSLDYNGTDEFLKILNTLSQENVFIISHKSDLSVDKFDNLIRFEKVQNFSRMTT
jgi:DNA repair exonuclease SbcCD ATPase subunit